MMPFWCFAALCAAPCPLKILQNYCSKLFGMFSNVSIGDSILKFLSTYRILKFFILSHVIGIFCGFYLFVECVSKGHFARNESQSAFSGEFHL